jgi:hypothetical protein
VSKKKKMLHTLPVELILHISRILRKRRLFKIREKLHMDGVFHRHVVIANYISNTKFHRKNWTPPHPALVYTNERHQENRLNSTILSFALFDPIHIPNAFIQILGTDINLKDIRRTVEGIRGTKMEVFQRLL